MITATVETREGTVTRRVRLTAPSAGRALELAGGPAKEARVLNIRRAHRAAPGIPTAAA